MSSCCRSQGWRAENQSSALPSEEIAEAIRHAKVIACMDRTESYNGYAENPIAEDENALATT